MAHHTPAHQGASTCRPILSRANLHVALERLVRATDAELAEWDRRLPAALAKHDALYVRQTRRAA